MIEIPEKLVRLCREADHVAVLTGAGISAESGVPTFRGADGLWSKLNPQELASMEAFMRNPEHVWEWYQHRRKIMREVQPNAAHFALVEMEKLYPRFSIATQNIDGLHRRAGSRNVFELHGNIERNRCAACGAFHQLNDDDLDSVPPRCRCGGRIRPDVVWFGEMLPDDAWQNALTAAHRAQIYFSIGTSAQVYPAAQLPFEARQTGAVLVEINLEPTDLTPYTDFNLRGPAGQTLPHLVNAVKKGLPNC